MLFFIFSLAMLGLALTAQFRSPKIGSLPLLWFFLSWLPAELPWAFALVQAVATLIYLGLAFTAGHPIDLVNLLALAISFATLALWLNLHRKSFRAKNALANALREGLAGDYSVQENSATESNTQEKENLVEKISAGANALNIHAQSVSQYRHWLKPFSFARDGVERLSDIAYGTLPRQQLDIIRHNKAPLSPPLRPVLLYVHGGGWVLGNKHQQALPLLNYLAQQGWICIDINYRLAPAHRFPDCLVDVKLAIAWLKTHIESFGGDPEFIAIAGGSAGGHLCALAALTANHPEFQPGFASADTQVQAAIPLYGLYDFTNASHTPSGDELNKFFTRYIMPAPYDLAPELWQKASPLLQIHPQAPPMFIIQGDNDCLALKEETHVFIAALRQQSQAPVLYAELEGAQHGFDMFHAVRTEFAIEAIARFLLHCYNRSRT